MKTNHLYQPKKLTPNQLFIIVAVAMIARALSNLFLRIDTSLVIIPRSLFANGFMMQASWLDIAWPISLIILLAKKSDFSGRFKQISHSTLLQTLKFFLFPILVSLALYSLVEKWYLKPELSLIAVSRFLQWIAAYWAVNLLFDALPAMKKWIKSIVIFLILFLFAYSQDLQIMNFKSLGQMGILSVIAPTGLILCSFIIGFRKIFKTNRFNALLAAIVTGALVCFVIPAMKSDNVFTLFIPVLSVIMAGIAIYQSRKFYLVSLSIIIAFALAINFLIASVAEKQGLTNSQNLKIVKAGSVEVYYGDEKVKEVAIQMGKVIDAANRLSMQEFGFSPDVKKLTIDGIAPGGFYADFDHSITGNIISEKYIQDVLTPGYLNVSQTSVNFPDPVNAILHEYSHLFGVVEYLPWLMDEEEGWATYAATRLSQKLYAIYGDSLYQPAYNFKAYADSITQYNLDNHSVLWSHTSEFGAFQLWESIGDSIGENQLFKTRWKLSEHDLLRQVMMYSFPGKAINTMKLMGNNQFEKCSNMDSKNYSETYSLSDCNPFGKTMNMSEEQISNMYELLKNQVIQPAIHLPKKYPIVPDLSFFILLIGFSLIIRLKSGSNQKQE
jgi:hypothetical protein